MQWLRDEGKIVLRDWWSLDTSRKTIKRSLEIWCCWGSRGIDLLLVSSLKIQFVTSSSWRSKTGWFEILSHHHHLKSKEIHYGIPCVPPSGFSSSSLAAAELWSKSSCPDQWCCWSILIKHGHWAHQRRGRLQVCIYDFNLRNLKVIVAR